MRQKWLRIPEFVQNQRKSRKLPKIANHRFVPRKHRFVPEIVVSYREIIVSYREIIVSYRESIVLYREIIDIANFSKMAQRCLKLPKQTKQANFAASMCQNRHHESCHKLPNLPKTAKLCKNCQSCLQNHFRRLHKKCQN